MLGYENRNSPLNHNRESLVGGHFDHQPNNRNALLRESGGYHFDNHHATVTLLVNRHGKMNSLNLISYIAGDFASGNGSIDPVMNVWTSVVKAMDKMYQ